MGDALKKLGEAELEASQFQLYLKGTTGAEEMAAVHADDFPGQIG